MLLRTVCRSVLSTVALAAFAAVAALAADAPAADPPGPHAVQVAPRVWMVQGAAALGSSANRNFISNAAFVVTEDRVVVVDALGSPPLAQALVAEIRRITPLPIRQVIVTHYHADHVYGLQVFKSLGAEIIAHESGRSYLNSQTAALRLQASRNDMAPWIDERTRLVGADRWISSPMAATWGGVRFSIEHAGPAHTAEDLVVWLPDQGVLIAGDVVYRGRVPFVGSADSRAWVAALDHLLSYDPAVIVPGHGPPSYQARDDLRTTRDYLAFLRSSMAGAARNLEPFDDAYARVDWSRFAGLPLFKEANRINAYNTYLLMEQQGGDAATISDLPPPPIDRPEDTR